MSITVFLCKSAEVISRATKSLILKFVQHIRRTLIRGNDFMHALERKRKFELGLLLVLWPMLAAAVFPAGYSSRLPLAMFLITALLSEAAAIVLFFQSYRRVIDRPEDRLTSWSVIGAAAAGACTLAFLIAAMVNAIRVW